jgi:hypothetical protein
MSGCLYVVSAFSQSSFDQWRRRSPPQASLKKRRKIEIECLKSTQHICPFLSMRKSYGGFLRPFRVGVEETQIYALPCPLRVSRFGRALCAYGDFELLIVVVYVIQMRTVIFCVIFKILIYDFL